MNTLINALSNDMNYTRTANGALAHKSTRSAVYDLFAFGGAYRNRTVEDCILLFKNAYEENAELALKCLFYLRDIRGGQGERRFFRLCFRWLCDNHLDAAKRNLDNVSEYGRWDDLIYTTLGTQAQESALAAIKHQLALDVQSKTPSLLAKWLPSENASSIETIKAAGVVREYLHFSHRQYRRMLSSLRRKINIVESLMSQNRWDEIEFDKIPSKAGLIYKNAFARRDIIAKKYEAFAKSKETKVNAAALYPYDVIDKAMHTRSSDNTGRAMVEKYWENLPDYLHGKDCKMMCVVDTSGSMRGYGADSPINVAIGLGMYCAERIGGDFHNYYISFASRPQLIKIEGVDFVDKVSRIYRTNLCDNTNLNAVFDLLLEKMLHGARLCDLPETIVVISDMQIDEGTGSWRNISKRWTEGSAETEMELIRRKWAGFGLKLPKLVYWNVNASKNTILDAGPNVTFVSGCSPVIFEQIVSGKTGYELMKEKLTSERYAAVK